MSELDQLIVVQDHDTRADQLRHRRASLPERAALAAIERVLAGLASEAATSAAERDRLEAEQARLEDELAAADRKSVELGRRLAHTSVPREAEAFQAELKGLGTQRGGLEDQVLALMEAIEPLEARLSVIAGERDELDRRADVARAELGAAEAVVDAELAEVAAARAESAAAVSPALLTRYERQRERLGGVAVARLENGHCTGCHLALSRREIDRIRAEPPDALAECEHCGRLLVR